MRVQWSETLPAIPLPKRTQLSQPTVPWYRERTVKGVPVGIVIISPDGATTIEPVRLQSSPTRGRCGPCAMVASIHEHYTTITIRLHGFQIPPHDVADPVVGVDHPHPAPRVRTVDPQREDDITEGRHGQVTEARPAGGPVVVVEQRDPTPNPEEITRLHRSTPRPPRDRSRR